MKHIINKLLSESSNEKVIEYIKSKNFFTNPSYSRIGKLKETLVFLVKSGYTLKEIKEIVHILFDGELDYAIEELPIIDYITEVIDNWGNRKKFTKKQLTHIVKNPSEWTDDQIIWDTQGISYFWDDLVNTFIIMGNELIYVEE
jgi:hypothetical protein